ncbi:MAG: VapE domain-containing protein [Phycisphaerales bacterium]
MSSPHTDFASSWDFLDRFHPGRLRTITGIALDKKAIPTETFGPDDRERFLEWIAACAAMPANCYFTVGEPYQSVSKKTERTDMVRVWWLHVDVDPRDGQGLAQEQARILALLRDPPGLPKPTCIVFSGGGYAAYWRLAEPIEVNRDLAAADDAGLYNLKIAETLGGDHCHSIDHVMRLPGTVNKPNAKKVTKGRVEALSAVIEWHDDRVYPLSEFKKATPSAQGKGDDSATKVNAENVRILARVDDLGPDVSDLCKVVIVNGEDPDRRVAFPSRSEAVFWVTCELVRSNVDDASILGVLRHPTWTIGDSIRDKGRGAARYAARQVERARTAVAEDDADFTTDEKGNPHSTPHNVRVSIHKQGARVWWDEFADRKYVEGLDGFGPHLDDKAIIRLWIRANEVHKLRVGKELFHDVVSDAAISHRRHPVREYLDELSGTWDGTPRADRWLIDYAGAEDTPYARAISRLPLIAAVRRIYHPGSKFDEMVILEGPQGGGKSSLLRALCPCEEWFTDDLPLDGEAKRFIEAIKGKWIIEAGELKGMRKAEADALKSALSRQIDRARMAYGREPVELPRQCVIFGTTNSERYLKDTTGNRRYWPIHCGTLDVAGLAIVRDQIWAEAVAAEADGASIRLDPSLYPHAAREQGERAQVDPFLEILEPALDGVVGKLRSEDAWTIVGKVEKSSRSQDEMNRLGEVMRQLGWERCKRRFGGRPEWSYAKGTIEERERPVQISLTHDGWRVVDAHAMPDYHGVGGGGL